MEAGNRRRAGSKSRLWWQFWWEHALWNGVVIVRMERHAVLVALLFVGTKYPSRKKKWSEESAVSFWFESKSIMEGKPGQPEPWSGSQVTHAWLSFPIPLFIQPRIPAHWRYRPHSGSVLLFENPLIGASLNFFFHTWFQIQSSRWWELKITGAQVSDVFRKQLANLYIWGNAHVKGAWEHRWDRRK